MPRINILSKTEIQNFEETPTLSSNEWDQFQDHTLKNNRYFQKLRQPHFRVSYILQYGYFIKSNKFYSLRNFQEKDLDVLCKKYRISKRLFFQEIEANQQFWRQRKHILEDIGYHPYKNFTIQVEKEIEFYISKRLKPKKIFHQITLFLNSQKVEIPSYDRLQKAITNNLNNFERGLSEQINEYLSNEQKKLLDQLQQEIIKDDEHFKQGIRSTILTQLKVPNQSIKASQIALSVQNFCTVSEIYKTLLPVLDKLNFSQEVIAYHASWTIKARYFQIQQFASEEKRYLHLLSFICHQYKLRQDNFVEVFLKSVKNQQNFIAKRKKEEAVASMIKKDTFRKLSTSRNHYKSFCNDVIQIIDSTSQNQIVEITSLVRKEKKRKQKEEEELDLIQNEIETKLSEEENHYMFLQKHHKKLLGKVGEIVKHLEFQENVSDPKLISIIQFYIENNGNLSKLNDITFLNETEQEYVLDMKGNVKNALCKVLLMYKIEQGLKSGTLNLKYSYKYLSYEEYLFSKLDWKDNREKLLKKAGLYHLNDSKPIIQELKEKLESGYTITNENFDANPHLKLGKDQKVIVSTPPSDQEGFKEQILSDFLPSERYYPLQNILSQINDSVNFIEHLEHFSLKYQKEKPDQNTFSAIIMALGCNIGIKKMSKIAKGISSETLENTKIWYFSPENLKLANNQIISSINQLNLPRLYITKEGEIHTSSDGQKFLVKPDSLNSNYSFKYFGKERGVSIYTFIDQKGAIFHSSVINSANRESTFVLDGLLNNVEIDSSIHSTDTHGYTEIVFGMMDLLDINFAPRIKNIGKQSLYSFHKKSYYEEKGYGILPDHYIKTDVIEENWDDILRILTSIKLQKCNASDILHRLNSYAKQNPLYRALKEFGRINKSIFILKYYDDLNLRKLIEKQLNLVEMSHRFAKFIFFDNNQEFDAATKEEQDIIAGCKQLIQNAIMLWNYMKITQIYEKMETEIEQQKLIETVQNSSIMSWSHVNANGEYVFVRKPEKDASFHIEKLKEVQILKPL